MLDLTNYSDFAADFYARFWMSAHPRSSGMFVLKKRPKPLSRKTFSLPANGKKEFLQFLLELLLLKLKYKKKTFKYQQILINESYW